MSHLPVVHCSSWQTEVEVNFCLFYTKVAHTDPLLCPLSVIKHQYYISLPVEHYDNGDSIIAAGVVLYHFFGIIYAKLPGVECMRFLL